MSDKLMEKLISRSPNRRNFVRKLGIAGAVVGAAGATNVAEAQTTSADNDIAILNFALNLEYLEAEFYTVATTGMTIDQLGVSITGTGTAGATTGGSAITWSITDNTVRGVAEDLPAMSELTFRSCRARLPARAECRSPSQPSPECAGIWIYQSERFLKSRASSRILVSQPTVALLRSFRPIRFLADAAPFWQQKLHVRYSV